MVQAVRSSPDSGFRRVLVGIRNRAIHFGRAWGGGGVVILGLFAFLVFVSIRLVRRYKSALQLAGWLLLLELVGAVLLLCGDDHVQTGAVSSRAWVTVGLVALLWTLPNSLALYSQRAKFTEPETKKPGA